jgi:putative inorganic carbon (HCO3(-)) transporter
MIVLILMASSFKMSQHGAIVWIRRGLSYEAYGITGGVGYFGNAADLGVQMLIFVPLALAFVLGCKQYWERWKLGFFVLMPITAVMTIIATGERGTLLGLAAMGLIMILAGKQKFRKLFAIALVGFAIFQLMPEQYRARFETAGTDGTSKARLHYWGRGIQMFKENPILGIGFNNWQVYYSQRFPGESLRAEHQEVAHSTPVTVLTEMGALGFATFYGMALTILLVNRRTLRILKASDEPIYWQYLCIALSVGLFGFLAASCFVTQHEFPFLFVQACLTASMYNVFVGSAARKRVK